MCSPRRRVSRGRHGRSRRGHERDGPKVGGQVRKCSRGTWTNGSLRTIHENKASSTGSNINHHSLYPDIIYFAHSSLLTETKILALPKNTKMPKLYCSAKSETDSKL